MALDITDAQRSNLVSLFHLESLNPTEQSQVLAEIGETVLRRALTTALARLDAPQRAELDALVGEGAGDEQVGAYLAAKLPDYADLFLETARAYHKEFEQALQDPQSRAAL